MQEVQNDLVRDDTNDYDNSSLLPPKPFWLAWKVGKHKSCPENFRSAKEAVALAISGGREFHDGFGDQTPTGDDEDPTFEECHDARKFTLTQCKGSVENTTDGAIAPVERDGGMQVLDVDEVGYDHTRTRNRKRKRGEMEGADDIDCKDKMPAMCGFLIAFTFAPLISC